MPWFNVVGIVESNIRKTRLSSFKVKMSILFSKIFKNAFFDTWDLIMILHFFTKQLTRFEVWLLAAGSFVFSLAVLNRWIATPLGLMSYGRIWQNHVS